MGLKLIKGKEMPSRVPSTYETELVNLLVWDQPGLHSKFQAWQFYKDHVSKTQINKNIKCYADTEWCLPYVSSIFISSL